MNKIPPQGRPYLITRTLQPGENQEHPIHFVRRTMTPPEVFYRRNHLPYPKPEEFTYRLPIGGEVTRQTIFTLGDLQVMPSRAFLVTLECAGNKRAYFEPKVFGEQWKDGAISQGVWKGVPLCTLLKETGLTARACEVVFEGYDYGERTDVEGIFHYCRSLPIIKALHPATIIAYELNGQPIPFKHGYPIRLIVPGWYGMASVKWLKQITVIDHNFKGPWQDIDYNYYPYADSDEGKQPVTTIKVNSTIQEPVDMSILDTSVHEIKGIAWTGNGTIVRVEISLDNGSTWTDTELSQERSEAYAWTFWRYNWQVDKPGEYTITVRASDSSGCVQPLKPEWNRKGYGFNAISRTRIKLE